MGDRLVTIAQFPSYIEAELAKQQLADFGIEAIVTGANTANMYAGLPSVGLPELLVPESKVEDAMDILESGKEQGPEMEFGEYEEGDDEEEFEEEQ
jgi:predicted Fe-Mo cluster-binding NifX family protein